MSMTKPTAEQVTFKSQGLGAITRTVQDKLSEVVSVKDFGAVGDGIADDTAAIQAAIDWVAYRNLAYNVSQPAPTNGTVFLPGGKYRITDTIHLGYGDTFRCVHLRGDGRSFFAANNFKGTSLIADFNDRPAIAISGGRSTSIQALTIIPTAARSNVTWIEAQQLANISVPPLVDDLNAANWVPSSWPASASSRYAPFCGIAIDPYAGPRPAVSYPDVTFPGWLNYTTQYNKVLSSDITIRDVQITGFAVACAIQPCDADGNGDFVKLEECLIDFCQYGLSVGNTQARDSSMNNCNMARCFGFVVTGIHGRQNGKPGMDIRNTSMGAGIWCALIPNMSFGSNVAFRNVYSEALYGIGKFSEAGGGSGESSVGFDECEFNFDLWGNHGRPTSPFVFRANGAATFSGCTFYSSGTVPLPFIYFDCGAVNLNMTNSQFITGLGETTLYGKVASNGSAGLIVGLCETDLAAWSVRQQIAYDITTGSGWNQGYRAMNKESVTQTRAIGIPIYATRVTGVDLAQADSGFVFPRCRNLMDLSSATSVSQTGNTVTLDLTGASSANNLFQVGGDVGDIMVHSVTKTAFVVAARTGLTVTLKAMNNLDASGNLAVTIALTGLMYAVNCRLFTLAYPHWGDTSTTSATVSNVQQFNGASIWLNDAQNGIQSGDAVFVATEAARGICTAANAPITAVTSNSFTLTGNARFNLTRERMDLFVRQPTPNNT